MIARAAIVAVALCCARAAVADDLPARIDQIVNSALAEGPAAGAAVEVVRNGSVIVKKGYGKADLELDVAMSERNIFRIGSITKQLTAAAIMRLVEAGKLQLDDEVGKLFPEAPARIKRISLRQLLTHTSGVKDFTELPSLAGKMTVARLWAVLAAEPLQFAPGARFQYSNSNYFLLGAIIERASGQSYRDFVRDEVTARAGLSHTFYCDVEPIVPDRARGYTPDGARLVNARYIDMAMPGGAGGFCSTVEDLTTWAQALPAGKVVSPASYAKMTTPAKLPDGKSTGYGFGLEVTPAGKHRMVSHPGSISGFGAALSWFPDDNLTVAVLVNVEGGLSDRLSKQIIAAILGLSLGPKK